jgi:AcrR family transcriptional regulator
MRKRGRPARISRESIAAAAGEIGLDDLTMKAVADHLGVSVASLYHHVEGKDDLLRLAAEHRANLVRRPTDHGQHWALWLLEWAIHNRDSFVAEPGLLNQYLEGAISADAIAENVNAILGLLVRQGFTIREAQQAYELVSSCAIGSAVQVIREQRASASGRSALIQQQEVLRHRDPAELPYLRLLLSDAVDGPPSSFWSRVTTILVGIAARRGESSEAIERLLQAEAVTGVETR